MKTNKIISQRRIKRIKAQGYFNFSNYEIAQLAFGNRFAYILCTSILFVAIVTANITLLSIILIIAFSAVVLPNHPFDYLYNYIISHVIRRPKLPTRSKQLKFACSLATCFIALTIYLFDYGYTLKKPRTKISSCSFGCRTKPNKP